MKKALPLIALTASAFAADRCAPTAPTCYTPDDCQRCYCLGPAEIIANAPVCPYTCDGDLFITVAGFYWKADEDGLDYAIDNSVVAPNTTDINNFPEDYQQLNNLIDAEYLSPDFKWDWGFKLGLGYCWACDGWDIGVLWTRYHGKASNHDQADVSDNHSLLLLWSAFQTSPSDNTPGPFAFNIDTSWKLSLDLIDIELGRNFWVSKYLSFRPHVGLRIGFIDQSYDFQNKGGDFIVNEDQFYNDFIELSNDFKGVGIRAGFDTDWHLGCGWSIYGNLAASIVYGRFNVNHDEFIRIAETPFTKREILSATDHFRASRGMLDLALGIQWMGMVCDCKYGILVALGWEQHTFFNQNQLWRVNRLVPGDFDDVLPNNTGENGYFQQRGTLSTEGITLTARFTF